MLIFSRRRREEGKRSRHYSFTRTLAGTDSYNLLLSSLAIVVIARTSPCILHRSVYGIHPQSHRCRHSYQSDIIWIYSTLPAASNSINEHKSCRLGSNNLNRLLCDIIYRRSLLQGHWANSLTDICLQGEIRHQSFSISRIRFGGERTITLKSTRRGQG